MFNMAVEIALIAVPVPLLAIARDIWIRVRVEKKEALDRIDRIEKERLDREQAGDIAVINTVPAFLALDDMSQEREMNRLSDENAELKREIERIKQNDRSKFS